MGLGTAAGIHFDLHQGVRGAHACTPHVGVGDGMSTPASCAMQAIGDAEPSAIISRTLTICLLIVLYFMPMRVWLSFFTVVRALLGLRALLARRRVLLVRLVLARRCALCSARRP